MKKLRYLLRHYHLFFIALFGGLLALPFALTGSSDIANWILALTIAGELVPLLIGMVRDLRSGTYGVDILAAAAIVTAIVMGEFWAALVIVLMLTGGKALEDFAEHRAERELEALLKQAPQKAHVLRGRKEVDVKASEVHAGDKIIIRPGELVPVDANILEGTASFDESSLTGESLPVAKEAGSVVLSGTLNLDGAITAKAIHSAADSQYQQIIKLVKSARHSQAPFVRLADRFAIPFTLLSFAIAIAAWVISGESIRFLEVLVVATPCPLILAAPIAIISGMSRSSRRGIIVKTGSSLERLAKVRTMAFDKTGTLTEGRLKVERITSYGTFRRSDILSLAASVEQYSNHSQAAAILERAEGEHTKLTPVKQVRELAGKGITAVSKGRDILVGRFSLLEEQGVTLPQAFKASEHDQTAAFIAVNGQLAGVIAFADEVRDESAKTLKRLRRLGITNFLMITGDNERTATRIAKKLGIDKVIAGALPGDKIRAIEAVDARPVAFVGDGVNDAPVLTASDVGIALGARGSAAASESADIVIMQDDLGHVAEATAIAKRTFSIARQSILIGIGLSVGLMLIFATGRFQPIYGALIQEAVDVVVIFNALRAHSAGRRRKP
jgi:heavy metal translocating P-type ATPase